MIKVLVESSTGRNLVFLDTKTGKKMTSAVFVKKIKHGNYEKFYVRVINGIETPCSKPDGNPRNNLG